MKSSRDGASVGNADTLMEEPDEALDTWLCPDTALAVMAMETTPLLLFLYLKFSNKYFIFKMHLHLNIIDRYSLTRINTTRQYF